jgi:Methyltransferase domain
MAPVLPHPRDAADRLLRRALERLRSSRPALVPEYPLHLAARWGWGGRAELTAVADLLEAQAAGYEAVIADACELLEWARGIPRHSDTPSAPCWENDYWGTVDALVQCAALRRRDPALYIEIGSGHSTQFARRAIEDFSLRTRIVAIDPQPRAPVADSCDELIASALEDVPGSLFDRLGAGDMLFLDGSHVAMMNTDATVFFLEVLPRLPAEVLVGIDDVFLPWDYPPGWSARMYSEQYLLAAMLLAGGGGFSVVFPGWWVVECSRLAQAFTPLWPVVENRFGRHASSFWIERGARTAQELAGPAAPRGGPRPRP